MKWVVLPGLDGTGLLTKRLVDLAPPNKTIVVTFPPEEVVPYSETIELIKRVFPSEPFLLIAESFSGPAALQIAKDNPPHLKGVVIAASFLRSPFPKVLIRATARLISVSPPIAIVIRTFLVGLSASRQAVRETQKAIKKVCPRVIENRLRIVADVDVCTGLSTINKPILFLWPTRDRLIPVKRYLEIQQRCPGISIKKVKGPHLLFHCCPKEVIEAISAFEDEIPPSPNI